jgi:hypothetical protein
MLRFSIIQTIVPKILVFSYCNSGSRFEYFYRRFVHEPVPSTIRRALNNDMVRFSVAQIMILTFSIALSMISKIIVWTMETLSISLNRDHRVVLGTMDESAGNFTYVVSDQQLISNKLLHIALH